MEILELSTRSKMGALDEKGTEVEERRQWE